MEKILDVANFIFEEYKKLSGVTISEMKLHKLLYFAQRETLAILNEPLFEETMQAWDCGPVSVDVKMIYTNNGLYADNIMPISHQSAYNIKNVILQYGAMSSWRLSEMAHRELSWVNARKTGSSTAVMSLDDIREDAKKVRPYDSLYDMYYDEFDDAEESKKYKAIEIVYWFLNHNFRNGKELVAANDEYNVYDGLTHLKLQNLLYYAQGVYLALYNQPLFEEDIEAGDDGPIVMNVYDMFLVFRGAPIIIPNTSEPNRIAEEIDNDTDVREVLEFVYDNFSIYTAWHLQEMSCAKSGPWYKTPTNSVIDIELIKEYFKKDVVEE